MKIPIVPVVIFLSFAVTLAYCTKPGIDFIGMGYDLIYGNPDGDNLQTGGKDPGIKSGKHALNLPHKESGIPDEVIYDKSQTCSYHTSYEVFTGSKSYQKKFTTQVSASAGGGGPLWDFSFSASAGFEEAKEETNKEGNVFFDKNVVCNLGTASYRLGMAKVKGYSVTEDFATKVCALPDKFSKSAYKKFISDWGTHLITKVEFGTKRTKRYKMSRKQFFTKAMEGKHDSVSAGGSALGYSASVEVNVDKFKEEAEKNKEISKSSTEIPSGTTELPVPIKTEITPIFKFIRNSYFLDGCPGRKKSKKITKKRIAQLRANMEKALEKYPRWVKAQRPSDPKMTVPLTWPDGFYGLPKTELGCPNATNFQWHEGTAQWGYSLDISKLSPSNHFPANTVTKANYCVKTSNDPNALLDWPAGSYCILQKGLLCPTGFASTGLRSTSTFPRLPSEVAMDYPITLSDTVPKFDLKGAYTTDRYFCCRDDGFASEEIYLPTEKPFYLLPLEHECQHVQGMTVTKEWWVLYPPRKLIDEADSLKFHSAFTRDLKEFYCYYEKV